MCVDKLFLTHFPPFSFFFFYVLQCIQTIDKHLNTAINFRKSRKITYTKRRQIIGWKEIPHKYNDRNFIFDYMQSRSDLHHKQIFLTLLILFSGITRQPLLFKVAYENTGRCINSFYEHKDFIIVQLHLYFCIYWYLLILKINLLPYYYKSTFYVHMIQSNYWRSIHC